MPCDGSCTFRSIPIPQASQWRTLALEVFLRAYYMLENFTDLLKFHLVKCCGTDYDEIPLHGALEVLRNAMSSMILKKLSKKELQRPGLFHDVFSRTRHCEIQNVPELLVHKMETLLTCLTKPYEIEDISKQVRSLLSTLQEHPSNAKELQILSFILREIMKRMACCGRIFGDNIDTPRQSSLGAQIRLTFDLVNNFIRDWSEKNCKARSCIKTCRFCDNAVDGTARLWGTFCCKDAEHFNRIWKEWCVRQSVAISDRKKCFGNVCPERSRRTKHSNILEEPPEQFLSNIVGLQPDGHTLKSSAQNTADLHVAKLNADATQSMNDSRKNASGIETIKHPGAPGTRRTVVVKSSDETETPRYGPSKRIAVGPKKSDRIEDGDLRGTKDEPRGRENARRSRNADRAPEYPDASQDGPPVKRDDIPYGGKPRGIVDRDLPGAERRTLRGAIEVEANRAENRRARGITENNVGPARNSYRAASRRMRGKESDAEGSRMTLRTHQTALKAGGRGETRIDSSNQSERTDRARTGEIFERTSSRVGASGKKRLGKIRDTYDEEKAAVRRSGERIARRDNGENREMVHLSKSKEAGRQREKRADAFDSERRGVPHNADDEGKVLKGDGKQDARPAGKRTANDDSGLTKKRDGVRVEVGTSVGDKSALDSEERKKGEGRTGSKKKGSGVSDSGETVDDDYRKINGSRYQRGKPEVSKVYDAEISPPNSIEYQLSNEHFVGLGWTVLPVTRTMRKIVQYQARTAKPHLDWFKKCRHDAERYYDDGRTTFINLHSDGSGEVYYPNGKLAIKVRRPEDRKYDIYTVYSPGGKDSVGIVREPQIVALFDTTGNGAVFDEDGTVRLSYNQIGGICRDNPTGQPFAWTWKRDEKKSIVKTVYTEKSVTDLEKLLAAAPEKTVKSPGSVKAAMSLASSRNKEKKVVEPVVEKREEEVESGSNHTKDGCEAISYSQMICMKLNEYLSLRILDRKNVSLRFLAGTKNVRIELGTVLNYEKEVASYFVDADRKNAALKCKFEEILSHPLDSNSSLHDLIGEFRKIERTAKQRRAMIAKYNSLVSVSRKRIMRIARDIKF